MELQFSGFCVCDTDKQCGSIPITPKLEAHCKNCLKRRKQQHKALCTNCTFQKRYCVLSAGS